MSVMYVLDLLLMFTTLDNVFMGCLDTCDHQTLHSECSKPYCLHNKEKWTFEPLCYNF